MAQDSADIAIAFFGCVGAEDTWAVIERNGDDVVEFQALTATQAADLKTEAAISLQAFATEASGVITAWSGWTGGERKACWRSARDG